MADIATVRDSIELHLLEPVVGSSEGLVKVVSLGDDRQHTPPGGDQLTVGTRAGCRRGTAGGWSRC